MNDIHLARRLEKALADDDRTNELGVRVVATGDRLVAQGEVASQERRRTVIEVLREHEPAMTVTDQITVSGETVERPGGHESIDAN